MNEAIQPPVAKAQMLVRRPVDQVFEAFMDPEITSHFWFSKGSGRLETGKRVTWDWEMYDYHAEVDVKAVEKNSRIFIEWGGGANMTSVEWTFADKGNDTTLVIVKNWGFSGEPDMVIRQAIDSTGGFSFLLAGAKVFLEHGIEPNLVVDHAPDAIVKEWKSVHAG